MLNFHPQYGHPVLYGTPSLLSNSKLWGSLHKHLKTGLDGTMNTIVTLECLPRCMPLAVQMAYHLDHGHYPALHVCDSISGPDMHVTRLPAILVWPRDAAFDTSLASGLKMQHFTRE